MIFVKPLERQDHHPPLNHSDKNSAHRRVNLTEVNVFPLLLLLGLALVGILVLHQYLPNSNPTSITALLALVVGCTIYVAHGHGRVTVLGLFNLALAMFVGLGGYAANTQQTTRVSDEWLLYSIVFATAAQGIVTALCWRSVAILQKPLQPTTASVCRGAATLGVVMMLIVTAAQRSGSEIALGYFGEGVGFVGAMLIICATFLRPAAAILSLPTFAALASLALYATVIHQGTGRLRIVALACAFLLVGSARFPRRALKVASLMAVPIALWWLARDRLNYQESIEQGASEGRTGLESMFSPITTLAQVLEAQADGWPLEWGYTFLSIPFIIIPKSVEANPPRAIGYDLVRLTEPSRVDTGFSEASTVFGEWVWNFGLWGLVLMLPLLAGLIWWLDRGFARVISGAGVDGYQRLMLIAFWATLGGTVADLAWSGLHTFATRILTRGPALLALYILFRPIVERSTSTSGGNPQRKSANGARLGFARTGMTPLSRPSWLPGAKRNRWGAIGLGVLSFATATALLFVYHSYTEPPPDNAEMVDGNVTWDDSVGSDTDTPESAPSDGAAMVDQDSFPGKSTPFRPSLSKISQDVPSTYRRGCHVDQESSEPQECALFEAREDAPTVVLVGDSHAAQWSDALRMVASEQGWNAVSFTKSACGVSSSPMTQPGQSIPYTSCTDWNRKLASSVEAVGADLILTSNSTYDTSYTADGEPLAGEMGMQTAVTGHREARAELGEVAPVIEILDLPTPGSQIECLESRDASECSVQEDEAAKGRNVVQKLAIADLPDVETMDFSKYVCQNGSCPAVVNGVVTFRDSNHITAEFSRSLAKPLKKALKENGTGTLRWER